MSNPKAVDWVFTLSMSASEVISGHGKEKVHLSPDDSVLTLLFSDGTINIDTPFSGLLRNVQS